MPFPLGAGILFGLGLGGFFDGIVLHQVLQWHPMLSNWYPADSVAKIERNTLWDGLLHSATSVFILLGLFLLWRAELQSHTLWSTPASSLRCFSAGWRSTSSRA